MARAGFVSKFEGELMKNAKHIATPGKGIFAADESTGTIGKRLENTKGKNVEANPQALRKLLTAQKALPDMYLSGLILSEDTLDQTTAAGKLDVQVLKDLKAAGVLPGIKFHNVKPAEELKTFKQRCREYYEAGARFAELHAILKINGKTEPSKQAIQQNAEGLARYAFICQENGLVPIVGPEVLTDGDHNIARCAAVTETVLAAVYNSLIDNHVLLEGTLLKPNMVTPGSDHPKVAAKEIAKHTVTALRRTVPAAVPGIVFLSGGQSEEEATQNVNAMNNVKVLKPWTLSFSFGQALQQSALETWRGKKENEEKAQKAFLARCKANSEATLGKYTDGGSSSDGRPLYKEAYR